MIITLQEVIFGIIDADSKSRGASPILKISRWYIHFFSMGGFIFLYPTGMRVTPMIRARPSRKSDVICPRKTLRSELEKTIKAMQAGSMHINVARA